MIIPIATFAIGLLVGFFIGACSAGAHILLQQQRIKELEAERTRQGLH